MADESLDYESLWNQYSPQPRNWFSSKIIYQGWGVATFENPVGTIEGPTKIIVDEIGEMKVEMKYKKLNTAITVHGTGNFKFIKFAQGKIGSKENENNISLGDSQANPCSKLTVQTKTGTFTSSGKVYCLPGFGLDKRFRFYITEGAFEVILANPIRYWNIPLVNLICNFHHKSNSQLNHHPLRLFTVPKIPEYADEKQKEMALLIANSANQLISFSLGDKTGHIEAFYDYSEKKAKLQSGQLNQCITALMICDALDSVDSNEFLYNYIRLINLASGSDMRGNRIEYRDKDGLLVRIKFLPYKNLRYQRKYGILKNVHFGEIGSLLAAAYNAPEFEKTYCQVLISYLIGLSPFSYNIEDRMAHLCRGLDSLCKEFGIGSRKIASDLPDKYLKQVNEILKKAREDFRILSRNAQKENLLNESNILIRLSEKAGQIANNKDADFGLKVYELLKHFNFVDAEILKQYYSDKSETKMSWFQTLSHYRNVVIHDGYFHIQDGTHDYQEISAIEDHLHDLMVRILLRILNYRGNYQPRVKPLGEGKTVDWVTLETTAADLGYGT